MKTVVLALAIAAAAACGGKAKKSTTPDTKAPAGQAGSTGGATYGGAVAPTNGNGGAGAGSATPAPNANPNHAADPCMGK